MSHDRERVGDWVRLERNALRVACMALQGHVYITNGDNGMSNVNKARPLPSVEYLNECFEYDSETGSLFWKERPVSHFEAGKWSAERKCNHWNKRFASKEAGSVGSEGYRCVKVDDQSYRVHRIIWKMIQGVDPAETIDHINGIRDDNRIANLREATMEEQMRNKTLRSDNTSGYIGVYPTKHGKWKSQGKRDGKSVHLGTYKCKHEAGEAAKEWRINRGYSDRHGTN